MSVKIVHAADFHLDSAFGALSAEQARQRRRESRELLTRLSNYVNQNGVDLVLLAGDLFDSDTTYRETLEALSEALGAMRARVFIAPGNHDPYSAKSPYATLSWPENVHVFTSKTVERVELPRTLGYQAREEQARTKQAAAEEILSLPTLNLKTNDAGLTDDQIAILRTLKDGALQVDDLIEKPQIPPRRVLSALTMMELEGYVEQGSGKHFSLTVTLLEE